MSKPISYAQRLEDTHLGLVLGDVASGTYIDVGGGHPVADNVSFHFYLKGWRGLVVEPQDALARLYAHVRPRDATVSTLVGRQDGEIDFHMVEGMHGFSTTVADNARTASDLGARITTKRMPMRTLASLVAEHGLTRVDFLKVDVEGAEADVLAGNDWTRLRPRVVVVEAVAPGSMAPAWDSFEPDMLARGYRFAFFDELNRFYVAEEEAHLAARFPKAPLAWDSVVHPWDWGRAHDNTAHPDHALAASLVKGLLAAAPMLPADTLRTLLAAAGADAPADEQALRTRLGIIAAAYDGGFLME